MANLNLKPDFADLKKTIIENGISGWGCAWVVLMLVSLASASVVLVRMLCWSRERWEALQEEKQKKVLQNKKDQRELLDFKNNHEKVLQKLKQDHAINVQNEEQKKILQKIKCSIG